MASQFEIKHIHGIPYYLDGTTVYTFEVEKGLPSERCIAIGTYDNESILYYENWKELVQSNLDTFRASLVSKERKATHDANIKPLKKPRNAPKNPRKSATRAKGATDE
jgi:hypothetical protein